MLSMRRILIVGLAVVAFACRGRAPQKAPQGIQDATQVTLRLDAGEQGSSDPAWPPGPGSLGRGLVDGVNGPVMLVEEREGIVARTATGAYVRTLVKGSISRADYDARIAVLWFLRGSRLEALDVVGTSDSSVPIVDEMPDILFAAGRGDVAHPPCDACVIVSTVPPEVGVTTEARASGGDLEGEEWERFERDRKIAATARPRLSPSGSDFLKRIGRRQASPINFLLLEKESWPLPRAASRRPKEIKWGGQRIRVGCTGGCEHGFSLKTLGWILLVAGRDCDCSEDRCWSTCVFYDPARKKYAKPSKPQFFGSDATPERACHPAFDNSGAAYILDEHRVCTSANCTPVTGRILGWIEPGMSTDNVPEDTSVCPE